jgi:hypothetical protein
MRISGAQGFDIPSARLGRIDKVGTSPGEALRIQLPRQQISRQTGMTSVPVRKRMNEDQAVMKPDRDLIGRVGSVRNLVAGIVAE